MHQSVLLSTASAQKMNNNKAINQTQQESQTFRHPRDYKWNYLWPYRRSIDKVEFRLFHWKSVTFTFIARLLTVDMDFNEYQAASASHCKQYARMHVKISVAGAAFNWRFLKFLLIQWHCDLIMRRGCLTFFLCKTWFCFAENLNEAKTCAV